MAQLLSKVDPNSIQLSRTYTYSTTLGKFLGILTILLLTLTFIYKIMAMINKQTLYLNSFQANDRSPVQFGDFQFRLGLLNGNTVIDYQKQFQYGFNVTMTETIWNISTTQIQQQQQQQQQKLYFGHKEWSLNSVKYKDELLTKNKQDLFIRKFQMIPCIQFPNSFCTPKELSNNLTLQGQYSLGDDTVIYYDIIVQPCNTSITPNCIKSDLDGYAAMFMHKCRSIDVYQRNQDQIVGGCDLSSARLSFIADQDMEYQSQEYRFKQINVTSYQNSFFPSIIPKFILPSSYQKPKFQQFWYYDDQSKVSDHKRQDQRWPYLTITFYRSRKSESYERRFASFDNILADIFGISGAVALIAKILLSGYANWSADTHIATKISDDSSHKYGNNFWRYLRQKIYCKKSQVQRQQMQQKKQIIQKANKSVDIIELTKKLQNFEKQISQIKRILSNHGMQAMNASEVNIPQKLNHEQLQNHKSINERSNKNKNEQEQEQQQFRNTLNQSLSQNLLKQND